jgi:hypothetical protein
MKGAFALPMETSSSHARAPYSSATAAGSRFSHRAQVSEASDIRFEEDTYIPPSSVCLPVLMRGPDVASQPNGRAPPRTCLSDMSIPHLNSSRM